MSVHPMKVVKYCLHTIWTAFSVHYMQYWGICISESCKLLCAMETDSKFLLNFNVLLSSNIKLWHVMWVQKTALCHICHRFLMIIIVITKRLATYLGGIENCIVFYGGSSWAGKCAYYSTQSAACMLASKKTTFWDSHQWYFMCPSSISGSAPYV